MTQTQQIKSHAKVATREQLTHWVAQLQALVSLTPVQASRLNIFSHELTLR